MILYNKYCGNIDINNRYFNANNVIKGGKDYASKYSNK